MPAGVTTIMPVFLRRPDLATVSKLLRAIQSVLSQDCGTLPLELLIVDDGSEPSVSELPEVRRLLNSNAAGALNQKGEDHAIRVLRLRANRGLSYALNAGLSEARYDLIARLDADDFWRPSKLARQLEMFAADPDLTLAASGMRLVHPRNPELDRDELRGADWTGVLDLTRRIGCPFPHGSILARRDVFIWLGGYPQDARFEHAEDFALWAQWIRFFKVSICEEILFEYTVSDGQISSRYASQQREASEEIAARTLAHTGSRIPKAIESIAAILSLDLISTSKVLFAAWKFYTHILADSTLFDPANEVLPDRAVHRIGDLHTLIADRFFYLTNTPSDAAKLLSLRCVQTPADILKRKP